MNYKPLLKPKAEKESPAEDMGEDEMTEKPMKTSKKKRKSMLKP